MSGKYIIYPPGVQPAWRHPCFAGCRFRWLRISIRWRETLCPAGPPDSGNRNEMVRIEGFKSLSLKTAHQGSEQFEV
jgi:hypothetical protein